MTTQQDTTTDVPARHAGAGLADGGLAAVGFALGLLPWWVHGARLPISSAWPAYEVGETPWVAVPFGEHRVGDLLALTVLAGALAVVTPHVVRRGRPRSALASVVAVALVLQLLALVQTAMVVGNGLAEREEASLLVLVLTLVAGLGGLAGTGLGLLLSRGGEVARVLSATALVWLLPEWLTVLVAEGSVAPNPFQMFLVSLGPWLAAALHGVGLARLGVRGPRRVATWVASLALAVAVPAMTIALSYAGSSARAGSASTSGRAELIDGALDLAVAWTRARLEQPGPLVLVVVVGLVGAAAWRAVSRPCSRVR